MHMSAMVAKIITKRSLTKKSNIYKSLKNATFKKFYLKTLIKQQISLPNSKIVTSKKQCEQYSENRSKDYNTAYYNAMNSNHILVLLKDPIYICGLVKLKLVTGCVKIYNYRLDYEQEYEIFSFRGSSFIKVEKKKKNEVMYFADNLDKLTFYFSKTDLEDLFQKYDKFNDAILLLEKNQYNCVLSNLKKYMKENIFPSDKCSKETNMRTLFFNTLDIRKLSISTLTINKSWNSVEVNENSKILVIGGKSVGKSTFVRCLINRKVEEFKKLLLIDLDIGQPELFIPQTINCTVVSYPILGPGFMLNQFPNKSYVVGSINVVLTSLLYIKAVQKLLKYCRENFSGIPWIINTMGYSRGFGIELIVTLIELITPSDVVQLHNEYNDNNFEFLMNTIAIENHQKNIFENYGQKRAFPKYQFHHFHSLGNYSNIQFIGEWKLNSKDMRFIVTVSRLCAILKDASDYLTNVKPMFASIDKLKLVNFTEHKTNDIDQLKAINGNIVYLCKTDDDDIYECFGIGIVRGIDYELGQVYVIPVISKSNLKKVNCLVLSEMPLPASILISQGPKIKGIIPYVYNTYDDSRSKFVKNNSLN